MDASGPRGIVLVACVMICGCGGEQKRPYYSMQETEKEINIVLYTEITDIPLSIPKTGKEGAGNRLEGSGNRQGNATRGGETVNYEVKYEYRGKTYTVTSVTVNGQEIPKSQ